MAPLRPILQRPYWGAAFIDGTWALAGLTVREAMRQRLWLLIGAAMIVVLFVIPDLKAVDGTSRMKLAVTIVSAMTGFVGVFLALLLISSSVRRDLDDRIGFLLFAKPLPKVSYLLGRWIGSGMVAWIAILGIFVAGSLAIFVRLGQLPEVRGVVSPTTIEIVDQAGTVSELDSRRDTAHLGGRPGNALRLTFTGLPQQDHEFLLRSEIRGRDIAESITHARLIVTALPSKGERKLLELQKDAPFGATLGDGQAVGQGRVVIRSRKEERQDLAQDYLRLSVPASAIEGGRLVIQANRLDEAAQMIYQRKGGAYLAHKSGGFLLNVFQASLIILAQAMLIAAVAVACITFSSLGVTLVGSLTFWFAGSTVQIVQETLDSSKMPHAAQRFLSMLIRLAPDFQSFQVESSLAAGRELGWSAVSGAWGLYGIYTLVFLFIAWIGFLRREQ